MSILSRITGRLTVNSHDEAVQKGMAFDRGATGRTLLGRPWAQPLYVLAQNGAVMPYQGPRLIDMTGGKVGLDYYKQAWLAT